MHGFNCNTPAITPYANMGQEDWPRTDPGRRKATYGGRNVPAKTSSLLGLQGRPKNYKLKQEVQYNDMRVQPSAVSALTQNLVMIRYLRGRI